MRNCKKFLACLLLLITVFSPVAKVSAEGTFYTYNYDFWGIDRESPDAYTPETILIGSTLGIGVFKEPQGLFVRDESVFICDSGNNRIVEVNKNFELIRVIDKVTIDGVESTLNYPSDIYVTEDYELYICDTNNYRVLHLDKDLNQIKVYTKPEDETFSKDQNLIPMKCVVDSAGRLYLLAKNVNKGFIEFDREGVFSGYVGANKVKASIMQVLEKKLATKAQRERMELFVPTEYSNISIDQDNFLFVTTNTFSESDLRTKPDQVNPIRRLNSLGEDILIRNGEYNPIGDLYWGDGGDVKGSSRFVDVTTLDNDTYYTLDRVRGRVFAYDFQGNMLYAFGGLGNKKGYYLYPSAIDHMGNDLLILDSRAATVTRLTLTEYGALINKGLAEYKVGHYDKSAEYWEQVLKLNGNYDLAYIGIGRALLRQEKYEEAMKYFDLKYDFGNYAKAFTEYRKEWVEENIGFIIAGAMLLILLPRIRKSVKKLRKGGAYKNEV